MVLEKGIMNICKNIIERFKNKELALYTINKQEKTVDLAIYDDFRLDKEKGRYLATNHLTYIEIGKPNFTLNELQKVKSILEKEGIIENKLYESNLNEIIYKIGDIINYENDDYGIVIDIDNDSNFPYAVVFPNIYKEDRPFWTVHDEIKYVSNKEQISEIKKWYQDNKNQIQNDIKNCNEMECDM